MTQTSLTFSRTLFARPLRAFYAGEIASRFPEATLPILPYDPEIDDFVGVPDVPLEREIRGLKSTPI